LDNITRDVISKNRFNTVKYTGQEIIDSKIGNSGVGLGISFLIIVRNLRNLANESKKNYTHDRNDRNYIYSNTIGKYSGHMKERPPSSDKLVDRNKNKSYTTNSNKNIYNLENNNNNLVNNLHGTINKNVQNDIDKLYANFIDKVKTNPTPSTSDKGVYLQINNNITDKINLDNFNNNNNLTIKSINHVNVGSNSASNKDSIIDKCIIIYNKSF